MARSRSASRTRSRSRTSRSPSSRAVGPSGRRPLAPRLVYPPHSAMPFDLAPAAFDSLPLYRYRIDIELERPLDVPAHQRGVLWRGAFGSVFRSLVCHDLTLDCAACPLRPACPYPAVFAPAIPSGRPVIARLANPPRPFVLADPHPDAPALPARTPLALGLNLVGNARAALPYFVVTLRKFGEDGIGRARARFHLVAARALDAAGLPKDTVFERGADAGAASRARAARRRPGAAGGRGGAAGAARVPDAADIRGGADAEGRRRRSACCCAARGIASARWRRSSATGRLGGDSAGGGGAGGSGGAGLRRGEAGVPDAALGADGAAAPGGGDRGTAVYEGAEVAGLMPWLRLAEVVGVGKHATFGNGRIAVEVLGYARTRGPRRVPASAPWDPPGAPAVLASISWEARRRSSSKRHRG